MKNSILFCALIALAGCGSSTQNKEPLDPAPEIDGYYHLVFVKPVSRDGGLHHRIAHLRYTKYSKIVKELTIDKYKKSGWVYEPKRRKPVELPKAELFCAVETSGHSYDDPSLTCFSSVLGTATFTGVSGSYASSGDGFSQIVSLERTHDFILAQSGKIHK